MPFAWFLALRYLRESKGQTALILAAVSVGVTVVVFLSALMAGLQASLVDKTLGSQAHITLRPPREAPRPLREPTPELAIARLLQPAPQRLQSISGWPSLLRDVEHERGVLAASPMLTGAGFAVRAEAKEPIFVRGVDPERSLAIIDIRPRMIAGRFDLGGGGVAIGAVLASTLVLRIGDKLRVTTTEGVEDVVTVTGVFSLGNQSIDKSWVITSLRHAQSLFALAGGATAVELKVDAVFDAERIATLLHDRTGLDADSWMKDNTELLAGLSAQRSSRLLIQFFVVLAVALGIASVLAVSVVRKSGEIGILRAFGTARSRVLAVFLVQGGVLGLGGALLGDGLGALLARLFDRLSRGADGTAGFPVPLPLSLFAGATVMATVVGLLAAVLPAVGAARTDPASAIRDG